jgi:hypothetical protein
MEHFTTARLIGKGWTAADLDAAFAIYGRDEVARWLGPQPRRPVPSLAHMSEIPDRRITRSLDQPDYGLWALERACETGDWLVRSPAPGRRSLGPMVYGARSVVIRGHELLPVDAAAVSGQRTS